MTNKLHEPRLAHVEHARELNVSRNRVSTSLVITGFMGTGKTAVGRRVAEWLGRSFVDMDAVIQAREGRTVQQIFAERGEDYFRRCERELCAELAQSSGLVIATGGGTLVDSKNRAVFAQAFVVCLDASIDALFARLENAKDRPLLNGDSVRKRLETLMTARQADYSQIERHADTTGKSIDQVAVEIIALFQAGQDEGIHERD